MINRQGFSMIELVFVIIILGCLAGTATTWLLQTRMDSQVAMTRSDIATILKQVPARVVAENVSISNTPPNGYNTWGEWLMDTPSLDKSKWQPTQNGLIAISFIESNRQNNRVIACSGNYIHLDLATGKLHFDPDMIDKKITFCRLLAESYNSGSSRTIDLVTNSKTIF